MMEFSSSSSTRLLQNFHVFIQINGPFCTPASPVRLGCHRLSGCFVAFLTSWINSYAWMWNMEEPRDGSTSWIIPNRPKDENLIWFQNWSTDMFVHNMKLLRPWVQSSGRRIAGQSSGVFTLAVLPCHLFLDHLKRPVAGNRFPELEMYFHSRSNAT